MNLTEFNSYIYCSTINVNVTIKGEISVQFVRLSLR